MLFNSIDFAVFLPIVFIFYWFVTNRNLKLQNFLLLTASYVFYGWWDWRFLSLIIFSTFVDYTVSHGLEKQKDPAKRKMLLSISVAGNLLFLGFFKYFNFFLDNFISAFTFFGMEMEPTTLNIVLPVGISFYTFQNLSYIIDVYYKKLEPAHDFITFSAFITFFPQLVAGPIERATNFLPQFYKKRFFNKTEAIDGLGQMLWGLFKKIVIADNCAKVVNIIFNDYADYSGSTLVLGAILFAFQIYCDFSGYSDIAIGTAKLFGFRLMRNFAFPYFSRDVAEFWRRWHISLSTWFRDYVYIPLGGSKGTLKKTLLNTLIIFTVSGFWHGANWTFIIWGALHALYFIPLLLTKRNRKNTDIVAQGKVFFSIKEVFQMAMTFSMVTFAWIFFRAATVTDAFNYIGGIFSTSLFSTPAIFPVDFLVILFMFIVIEWLSREKMHPFELSVSNMQGSKVSAYLRPIAVSTLIWSIILWGAFDNKEFIYFQF
jgi:alginate O-acetyltransferase complex protein AlgI